MKNLSKTWISFLTILIFAFCILILPGSALAQTASLSLSPATATVNKNCPFAVDVKLDTGGVNTDGTDAILLFDPSRITATSITNGTIYSDYPGNNIDNVGGKVTVSGLASISSPFTGSGTLATVNFQVLENAQAGATQVTFDFDPNNKAKTTDSNVVQRGTVVDVLNSVVNGSYTIGTGACGATASPPPQGQTATPSGIIVQPTAPPAQFPTKNLPPAGSEQLTFTIAIIGSTLTILGILGLAML